MRVWPAQFVRSLVAGSACALAAAAAAQTDIQPEPGPLPNDLVTCSDPSYFRAAFRRARCGTVRALILGDSQETSPTGAGDIYIPRLQYEFWLRGGNAPETPLAPVAQSTGGGRPYADWLIRTANPDTGVLQDGTNAILLPGWISALASTSGTSTVNPAQFYGAYVQLEHNCAEVNLDSLLRYQHEYFDRNGEIYLEIFALSAPQSGEVEVRVLPTLSTAVNYYATVVQTFTTSMGLGAAPSGQIRSQLVGPLDFFRLAYLNVELRGTRPDAFTTILGARFVNATAPQGWSIISASQQGYEAADVLRRHSGSGPFLAALRPDVVFLTFGANDAGHGVTAELYRNSLAQLISFLRAYAGPDVLVVIIPDPYRDGLTTAQETAMGGYVTAARTLTVGDPRVCVVNSRDRLADLGWRMGSQWNFLADGVHYSATGAILKAHVEAELLDAAFGGSVFDCNGNGIEDLCDIQSGTSADADHDGVPDDCGCNADYNQDGGADNADVTDLANDIASGSSTFPGSNTDFNRDGGADNADVSALADRISGGPCP